MGQAVQQHKAMCQKVVELNMDYELTDNPTIDSAANPRTWHDGDHRQKFAADAGGRRYYRVVANMAHLRLAKASVLRKSSTAATTA